jgi:TATA-box binding protein (TBP) (component of TFIID and TFIIIB)
MTAQGITPSALREQLDSVGAELNNTELAGYVELEHHPNLNAIAIGLGLENISYEPERFPGLIYHVDRPQVTVVLFNNGVITTVDAEDDQAVKEAISKTVDRLEDLGLIDIGTEPSVEVDIDTIPIANELEI